MVKLPDIQLSINADDFVKEIEDEVEIQLNETPPGERIDTQEE